MGDCIMWTIQTAITERVKGMHGDSDDRFTDGVVWTIVSIVTHGTGRTWEDEPTAADRAAIDRAVDALAAAVG